MSALTAKRAEAISPDDKSLADGTVKGLVLEPGARKGVGKWTLRFVSPVSGKRRAMGLGPYPTVSLKEAPRRAQDAGRDIEAAKDPIEERKAAQKAAKPIPTFREIAALVI